MTKLVGIAILACVAVLLGIVLYVGAGGYDIGADTPHWEMTRKVMEIVRDRSIAVRADQIEVPDLQDGQLVLKGAGQYAANVCELPPCTRTAGFGNQAWPLPEAAQPLRAARGSQDGILGD